MHLQANRHSYSFSSCYIFNSLPYELLCTLFFFFGLGIYLGAVILKICPQILRYLSPQEVEVNSPALGCGLEGTRF